MKSQISQGLRDTAILTVEMFVEYVNMQIEIHSSEMITPEGLESLKNNFINNIIPKTK